MPGDKIRDISSDFWISYTCSMRRAKEFCSSSRSIGCPFGSFAPLREDFISFNPEVKVNEVKVFCLAIFSKTVF